MRVLKKTWPSAFSFVAWLVPISISLAALWYSRQASLDSRVEAVLLQVSNYGLGEREVVGRDYRVNLRMVTDGVVVPPIQLQVIKGVLVDNYWKCLVANTGGRTISIVALDVRRNGSEDKEPFGFFEAPDEPVRLPITIEAGASRRLLLLTAIALDPKAIDALHRHDKLDSAMTFDALFNALLFKAGVDHYGNSVRILPGADGYARFEVAPIPPQQERFRLRLRTARGNYFQDDFWWYKRSQF